MDVIRSILRAHLAIAMCAAFACAQANVVSGELWHVPDAVARDAILSNIPGTTPDVTFDVNSPLNFTTPGSVQTFLNSGGAFNIVENTAGTLASTLSNGITSTLMYFTGFVTVTTGEQFTVTHDDGLTLIIGGLDLGFNPGPTAPITSTATYNGPSGNLPFQLLYGECCSGAAVLQVNLPFSNAPGTGVPEPGTAFLLVIGLMGLGVARRPRLVPQRLLAPPYRRCA